MADFKDQISPALVDGLATDLARVGRGFDSRRFVALASDGLDGLALTDRVRHIAAALVATMPSDVDDADRAIRAALDAGGLAGWSSWPVCEYVAITMLDEPEIALPLLAELTPRFSAEFAIRPLVHYQGATGRKAGKVFKLATRTLVAGQPITIECRHRFAHVSIRQIRPGPHRIEIQVNGRVLAGIEVDVTP